MDHGDIVSLIKGSGITIQLTVEQSKGEIHFASLPYVQALHSQYT